MSRRIPSSSKSDDSPIVCLFTTTPHMNALVKTFYGNSLETNVLDGLDTNVTVDDKGNPRDMEYKKLTYSEATKLKSMQIVGVLDATPVSAMKAIESKFDEETIERNLFLCGLSLISMGYLPTELKLVKDWTVYDRKRNPVRNPPYGLHFVINSKPNSASFVLPIHSEFAPTAHYLNDNPKVWKKIKDSFDFDKMFKTHKSKIHGVALLENKGFKQYLAKGGKFETICNYVNWLMGEFHQPFMESTGTKIGNFPNQTLSQMKADHPDFYLMEWKTIMECAKVNMEPNLKHADDYRKNPVCDMIGSMISNGVMVERP